MLRQRPGTAKGITFVTLEDETGAANLIIHPRTWERLLPHRETLPRVDRPRRAAALAGGDPARGRREDRTDRRRRARRRDAVGVAGFQVAEPLIVSRHGSRVVAFGRLGCYANPERSRVKRNLRLVATALVVALYATSCGARPSVLVVIADDMGWGDLSRHGNTNLSTPNLDRLAAEGVSFDRFYVQPVCAPTRAELLTGRYAPRGRRRGSHGGRRTVRR